jgi:hypothetical protein
VVVEAVQQEGVGAEQLAQAGVGPGGAYCGSLAPDARKQLRDECRRGKERLSDETATAIVVENTGTMSAVKWRLGYWPVNFMWIKPLTAGAVAGVVTYLLKVTLPLDAIFGFLPVPVSISTVKSPATSSKPRARKACIPAMRSAATTKGWKTPCSSA